MLRNIISFSQYPLNYMLIGPEFKKPQLLKFHFEKVCPKCDFESKPAQTVSAFSPYSALGACPNCNGYGANLVYDDKKIIDKELTIQEGGLKLLNYGPFQDAYESLLKILKKNKIPTDTPIKKLPKDFFELLDEGQGAYPGYTDLKKYLSYYYKDDFNFYFLGLFCYNQGNDGEAINALNKAIAIKNDESTYYKKRAQAYFGLKMFTQATNDCNKAINVNAKDGEAYYIRGTVNGEQKNKSEACADWKKAMELGYDDVNGYYKDICK